MSKRSHTYAITNGHLGKPTCGAEADSREGVKICEDCQKARDEGVTSALLGELQDFIDWFTPAVPQSAKEALLDEYLRTSPRWTVGEAKS